MPRLSAFPFVFRKRNPKYVNLTVHLLRDCFINVSLNACTQHCVNSVLMNISSWRLVFNFPEALWETTWKAKFNYGAQSSKSSQVHSLEVCFNKVYFCLAVTPYTPESMCLLYEFLLTWFRRMYSLIKCVFHLILPAVISLSPEFLRLCAKNREHSSTQPAILGIH